MYRLKHLSVDQSVLSVAETTGAAKAIIWMLCWKQCGLGEGWRNTLLYPDIPLALDEVYSSLDNQLFLVFFFPGLPESSAIRDPGIQCTAQQPSKRTKQRWVRKMVKVWFRWLQKQWHMSPLLFLSHVSKWFVLGQNWGRVRPGLPDCCFFTSHPAGYEKTLWFHLSRRPRLLWQPDRFPGWGKKRKEYFWTLSVEHTCACSLLLKYHQGKLREFSKKCVLSFPCLPLVCFCCFPKQLDFQTKSTGTLLWVSWLFLVHVSLAIPLFKQRFLYMVYEVEPRANIITVSCSELTPTKPPSAVLQQDFMSSCSPAPKVWLCPSSAQSSESFDSAGQDCEQCHWESTPCLTQTGLHSWNPGALSGEGKCWDFQSHKRQSSSLIWTLTVDRVQKLKWFEGKAFLQGQGGKK